jgi:hypothetical protein
MDQHEPGVHQIERPRLRGRVSGAEELDAFDARVAKVAAAVRGRRYGFDPARAS